LIIEPLGIFTIRSDTKRLYFKLAFSTLGEEISQKVLHLVYCLILDFGNIVGGRGGFVSYLKVTFPFLSVDICLLSTLRGRDFVEDFICCIVFRR